MTILLENLLFSVQPYTIDFHFCISLASSRCKIPTLFVWLPILTLSFPHISGTKNECQDPLVDDPNFFEQVE